MVAYLVASNVGASTSAPPSITLPTGIAANSLAYLWIEATSGDAVLGGFTGWTVVDGPKQAGNSVGMGWLLSKSVGTADSGTTHSGTLTTAGTPRWATGVVVASGVTQSTVTYGVDSTVDTSLVGPAFTPTVANAEVLMVSGLTLATGQTHMSVTGQPTGFAEILDAGSSYGSLNELNVYAATKTLTGGPTAQTAPTATLDKTARANTWVITFAPVTSSTVPTFVGGSAIATGTVTGSTITYPTGIQSGDVGILIASYNGSAVTPDTPAGWTAQGAPHQYSTSMFQQVYKRTMVGTETGNLSLTWGTVLTKTAWTISVWRGAQLGPIAFNDAASDAATTVAVPAVATPNGTAVFSTSWFERSSTPDTGVTIPSGTTLTGSAFGTGAGASSAAVARNATADSDGSVGSGVWTKTPGNSGGTVAVTVALYGSAAPVVSSSDVWFVMQADRTLKAQSVSYA